MDEITVCADCGATELVEEGVFRLTGQVGGLHEEIVVAKCVVCGNRMKVDDA